MDFGRRFFHGLRVLKFPKAFLGFDDKPVSIRSAIIIDDDLFPGN